MLDNAGKGLEKFLTVSLRAAVALSGDLSLSQHGFRKGRSTIGAMKDVSEMVSRARQGNHRTKDTCVLVALDVRNAFNSVR